MSSEPCPDLSTEQLGALRATYQGGMAAASEACPGDETLAAVAVGELTNEERAWVADHIVGCTSCAASFRTLRELHAEAAPQAGETSSTRGPRLGRVPSRTLGRSLWAAAAMFLLAILAFRFVGPAPSPPTTDLMRSAAPPTVTISPQDGAKLVGAPSALAWQALVAATGYQVRLFDAEAEPLWESAPVSEPRIDLPPTVVDRLDVGQAYFWVVRPSGGVDRRELGPFWFEVGE